MAHTPEYNRPPFAEALRAWNLLLEQRGFPSGSIWVFDENLCFEKDTRQPGGFRLGIQTTLTPPPPESELVAYDYFTEFAAPLVFYRIGSCHGKSVCLLLCDEWFAGKTEADGFIRRDDWGIFFRPGAKEELEEITDKTRWANRLLRDRPLHDLDFCMTLRAIHESFAHGRVLSSYERSALRFLHIWRRIFGPPEHS